MLDSIRRMAVARCPVRDCQQVSREGNHALNLSYRLHTLHFRNACLYQLLHALLKSHLRKWAAKARTKHPHITDLILKLHKFNIAQMLGDEWANLTKRRFYFLFNGRGFHF